MKNKRFRARLAAAGILFLLTLGLIYAFFPFLWMVSSSVKSNNEIFVQPPQLLPRVFTLATYQGIFQDPGKLRFHQQLYRLLLRHSADAGYRHFCGLRVQPL